MTSPFFKQLAQGQERWECQALTVYYIVWKVWLMSWHIITVMNVHDNHLKVDYGSVNGLFKYTNNAV